MTVPAFTAYCARVEARLQETYGIRVITRPIARQLKGDLDGLEIHIDPDQPADARLFLLVHLFGHTVQWNTEPDAFELGTVSQLPVAEELLQQVIVYEIEAARYGLALLHECGITAADQWFFDYSACDQAYLLDFYRTAAPGKFAGFWRDNTPPIEPKPVPRFTPTKRKFRLDGVVI